MRPPSYKLGYKPMNTIDISPTKSIVLGVMFTTLNVIERGPLQPMNPSESTRYRPRFAGHLDCLDCCAWRCYVRRVSAGETRHSSTVNDGGLGGFWGNHAKISEVFSFWYTVERQNGNLTGESMCKICNVNLNNDDRRKFRSQTSDNMDRWKAEQGRGREKRKIRRKKSKSIQDMHGQMAEQ